MKVLLLLAALLGVTLLGLPLLVVAVIATHPWLAIGTLSGPVQVHDERPPAVANGVPAAQWPLMVQAAQNSSCGVTAEHLAAIAKLESDFGQNLLNPRSGTFGYGQFDVPTWTTFGGGNPDNPADALPAIARTLCARGYGTDRAHALNSYGGCVTGSCLGATDYATAVGQLAAALRPVQGAVQVAQEWLGVPYVFGGCSRSGVDCSCLVQLVYHALGVTLPRVAADQWNAVQHIARVDLQPGDLVFFRDTYMPGISHVGIYVGGDQQINAPTEGQRVSVQPVFGGYWGAHFAGAGRVTIKP